MPMLMPEQVRRTNMLRSLLLVLTLLTTPLALLGISTFAFALPGMDVGFFLAEVRVENKTNEMLYITPITTTYAEPRVIQQKLALRQRDHLLRPADSMRLAYDTADFPLAGIVVCRTNDDCRLLENTREDVISIERFDALPTVDEQWLIVVKKTGLYNFAVFIYAIFILLPFIFFWLRWRLGKQLEKTYS